MTEEIPAPASRPDDAPPATDESTSVETVGTTQGRDVAPGNSPHPTRALPRRPQSQTLSTWHSPPDSTVVIVEVPDHDAERRAAEAEARAARAEEAAWRARATCNTGKSKRRLPNRETATAAGEIDNAESLISVLRIATPGVHGSSRRGMNGPPEKPPGDAPNRGTVLNESDAGKHSRPAWSATGNVRHGEPLNGRGCSGNNVAHSAPRTPSCTPGGRRAKPTPGATSSGETRSTASSQRRSETKRK